MNLRQIKKGIARAVSPQLRAVNVKAQLLAKARKQKKINTIKPLNPSTTKRRTNP